ncbi:MAG: response regulator [Phycisphaerales bacterium]
MADILHDDLQQQLAAMKFHLGLLSGHLRRDPEQRAKAAHLDQMLKDAVQTSRSLSHELSPAIMNQNDLAETFEWLARQMHEQHGLVVRVHTHGEVLLESDAMKAFLYKAGQEFLFNIIKHARVDEATIRLRRFNGYVCLSVADHGRGFDPRAMKETAGFGLFSIRERVELLGGRMKIRSAPGRGSTLLVIVPHDQIASEAQQTRGRERESAGPSFACGPKPAVQARRLRVLVADDHEVVRQGLRAVLEEAGIEVVGEAANGREAVNLAVQLEPDVVIMDVTMPLIHGDGATRQIRKHLPEARVVALSMYDEPETRERMRRAGAQAYILKTAPSEELLAAIRGRKPEA